jgi:hypothetical protein
MTTPATSDLAQRKPIGSKPVRGRKVYGRSRISNGHDLLPDVDGRSLIARRYRDIANAIFVDQGGIDHCSESRQQLIRRFAAAAVLAEQMEGKLARGEEIDIQQHALLCSTLVRVGQRIGINRVPKDVITDPLSYARSYAEHDESDERDVDISSEAAE